MGDEYVNLESPASASRWTNITRSQRNREPGDAATENPEGPEQGQPGMDGGNTRKATRT